MGHSTRTELTKERLKREIREKLTNHFGRTPEEADDRHFFGACALVMRDILAGRMIETRNRIEAEKKRQVHYLSMEFLIGRSLKNNAFNLGIEKQMREALAELGADFDALAELEPDPGLGNGGLGRLAACYMDGMATLGIPGGGFSIRYQHGVFKQKIIDGQQIELPDSWLEMGENFMIPQLHRTKEVRFGGTVEEYFENGRKMYRHSGYAAVLAVPYDMPISGYRSKSVAVLKLWEARSPVELDMNLFSRGEYLRSMEQNALAEVISMVLYPEANHREGQSLRLKQQYFFVSATIQYLFEKHKENYGTLRNFAEKNIIQINDTHPALVIPEMMRLLMDEERLGWEESWDIVTKSVAYTNHTVMSEALERWPEELFSQLLPRIDMIVREINERFCRDLWNVFPGEFDRIARMAVTAYGEVRMAHLAIAGSCSVNGVSELHSKILKDRVFHDFYLVRPEQFHNVTNGIAHRRWLCQANPALSALIRELIGKGFYTRPYELGVLNRYQDDNGVLTRLAEIKRANKERLARYIKEKNGIAVDPASLFDVQAKRLHEYKRQLLNLMGILDRYYRIKSDPNGDYLPKTYIFAAKASPGYQAAKEIIRLINGAAKMINEDPAVRKWMKVVFLEDYRVTLAELLIPASELSEQISTAGKEASGTGNMKFMMNGALTVGTMDGANVEICEAVGKENMFVFGLKAEETEALLGTGLYNPAALYQQNSALRRVLDGMNEGVGDGVSYHDLVMGLTLRGDPYLLLADFDSYVAARRQAEGVYRNAREWNQMALRNVAASGRFAADRSVVDYAREIWRVPVKYGSV